MQANLLLYIFKIKHQCVTNRFNKQYTAIKNNDDEEEIKLLPSEHNKKFN